METENRINGEYTIDLLQLAKALLHRIWVIILAGVLGATICFSYAFFLITPTYSSSVLLYVNNNSLSLGSASFSLSSSDISASRSLVKTYSEILKNRTTLERVIAESDVNYTFEELNKMITAGASGDTEIMKVTVVSEDPEEAAKIANCITEILPERISEIINGANMRVIDSAVPDYEKIAPSITKYTAIGLLLGVVVAVGIIVVITILDDTIHDEDYILQTYKYPILARIPDLAEDDSKHHSHYYQNYYQSQSESSK